VGYHNEHHDFPSIPWTRLPALKALAPEFYETLPSHPSWPMILVNFIRDPEVGIFARAKRLPKAARLAQFAAAPELCTPSTTASDGDGEDTGSDHVASGSDSDSKKSD
jgi:sphingolipid 4-desaturase/C4-monooxygenase